MSKRRFRKSVRLANSCPSQKETCTPADLLIAGYWQDLVAGEVGEFCDI